MYTYVEEVSRPACGIVHQLVFAASSRLDILAYTPREFEEMLENTAFLQDVVSTGKVLYEVPS
jgi:hypothetical protein